MWPRSTVVLAVSPVTVTPGRPAGRIMGTGRPLGEASRGSRVPEPAPAAGARTRARTRARGQENGDACI